jgi:GNAT superfamily N-acetyltransferase
MMTLGQFYGSKFRNAWIRESELSAYVRRGYHCVDLPVGEETLDVANISVDEEARGQGVFSHWMEKIAEREARSRGIPCEWRTSTTSGCTDGSYDRGTPRP